MYRAAHSLKPDDIEKLASANVIVQKSSADTFMEGGKFLPLSVWRQQGFEINEENIADEDKDFSEVFGATIRLRIRSRMNSATTDVAATITLAQKRGLKRKSSEALPDESALVPLALGASAPEALALAPAPGVRAEDAETSSSTTSDSSSASSSDSSSSSGKNKKKSKKNKKKAQQKKKKPTKEQKKLLKQKAAEAQKKQEEKEAQRQAKYDDRASAMSTKAKKKLTDRVDKVLPKLQYALQALKDALANHKIILVPSVTMAPIQRTYIQAEALVAALMRVARGEPFPEDDVGAVKKAVMLATKDLKDVFKILGRNS